MEIKKYFKDMAEWFLMTMFGALVGLWLAYIIANIIRGNLHVAFDGIVMATLCVLCFITTKRMERLAKINAMLAEEVQMLSDVKKFVEQLREMVKKDEMEQEVADIMKEHFEKQEEG